MAEFKVGDIVDWSDVFRSKVPALHQGPFVIKSRDLQAKCWRIYGYRIPIEPNDYFLVDDYHIKQNVFLNAVREAVKRG